MNPDQPSRDQIETRITALLLGELPANEAELLRYTIGRDPALQKLHDQLQSTLTLVREAEKHPAEPPAEKPAPLKLSDDRRQKLLEHFKTTRPEVPQDPLFWLKRIEMPRLVSVLALIAVMALLAAMLLPVLSKTKSKSLRANTLMEARRRDLEVQLAAEDQRDTSGSTASSPAAPAALPSEPQLAPPPAPVQIVLPQTEPAPETASAAQPTTGLMSAQELAGHIVAPGTSNVYSQNVVGYSTLSSTPPPATAAEGTFALQSANSEAVRRQGEIVQPQVRAQAGTAPAQPSFGGAGGFGGAPAGGVYDNGLSADGTTKSTFADKISSDLPATATPNSAFPALAAPQRSAGGPQSALKGLAFDDSSANRTLGVPSPAPFSHAAAGEVFQPAPPAPDSALPIPNSALPTAPATELAANEPQSENSGRRYITATRERGTDSATPHTFYRNPVQSEEEKKTPILGDVHVVGNLFQSSGEVAASTPAATVNGSVPPPRSEAANPVAMNWRLGQPADRSQVVGQGGTSPSQTPAVVTGLPANSLASDRDQNSFAFKLENGDASQAAGTLQKLSAEIQPTTGSPESTGANSALMQRSQNNNASVAPGTSSSGFSARSSGTETNQEWIGMLERPEQPQGPRNHFIARNAYIALPSSNYLALDDSGGRAVSIGSSAGEPVLKSEPLSQGAVSGETMDLNEALDRYAQLTGRTILRSSLPSGGKISIDKSLSEEDQAAALQAALALNGVSTVNIGGQFVKAVTSDEASAAGAPMLATSTPPGTPESQLADLEKEYSNRSNQIQLAQDRVESLRQNLHVTDTDPNAAVPTPTLDTERLQMIHGKMIENEALYSEALFQLEKLQAIQKTNEASLYEVLPQIVEDDALNDLVGKLHQTKQRLAILTNVYPPTDTSVVKAQSEKDALDTKIHDRVDGIMAGLQAQVDSKKAALDDLSVSVKAAREKDEQEAIKNQPYNEAERDLVQKEAMHKLLYSRLEAEKIDATLPKSSMVQVIVPAEPATNQTFWQRLTGQYESKARIKVENDVNDIDGVHGTPTIGAPIFPYGGDFIHTNFVIMQSERVLGHVVDSLNLQSAWATSNGGEKLSRIQAIEKLKQHLEINNVKNTKFVEIGVTDTDPKEAADIANGIAKAYRDYRIESRHALVTNSLIVLQQQYDEQEHDIQTNQEYVEQLREKLQLNGALETAEYISEEIPIRYAKTDDIASKLTTLTGAKDQHGMPLFGQTKVIVNERSGSLLIYASRSDMLTIKGIVAKLDTQDAAGQQSDLPLRKPAPNTPVPQPEILTSSNNFSTFSMNVSDVSFKFAEASLENNKLPDTASIRSEEFVNAFDYRDPEAAPGQPMAFNSELAQYPFNQNRELLRFSVKAAAAGRPAGRALNLVLLLDTSGSMERADRVEIIREALRVLSAQLQPNDIVSVVSFARTARLWADGISGDKAGETLGKVGSITPEGGTNLEEAMRLAYETARRHYLPNGMNRVVLLTDGAANLGNVDPNALEQKVDAQRKQGIALDCFGIGWEDYNDDLLEELSSNGDGRYAFLNSPEDAARDFGTKLAGALQVAAQDLKVQVEFNPQRVTAYRQIGYAKHQLTKEQFRDNTVAAGEIASQEAGNALYTIETNPNGDGPIATVHVRYRVPGTQDYREHSWDVPYTGHVSALDQSSPAMRLAATAAAFSEWLAASPYAQEVTPDDLLKYLTGVPEIYGADDRPKQLETMIREAKSLEGK